MILNCPDHFVDINNMIVPAKSTYHFADVGKMVCANLILGILPVYVI